MINQVKGKGKRIVFPEGDNETVLRAAAQLVEQRICSPFCSAPLTASTAWWRNSV